MSAAWFELVQPVAGNVMLHRVVDPTPTVTEPVGVPANCGVRVAVKVAADSLLYVTEGGEIESAVADVACVTLRGWEPDADVVKLASPLYVATTLYGGADAASRAFPVSVQLPAPLLSELTVQRVVSPTVTLTEPVGVPLFSGVTVTRALSLASLPYVTEDEESTSAVLEVPPVIVRLLGGGRRPGEVGVPG